MATLFDWSMTTIVVELDGMNEIGRGLRAAARQTAIPASATRRVASPSRSSVVRRKANRRALASDSGIARRRRRGTRRLSSRAVTIRPLCELAAHAFGQRARLVRRWLGG